MVKINWSPNSSDLRKFGLTFLVGFAIIGLIVFFKGWHEGGKFLWAVGFGVGLLAIISPPLSKPLYWAWMGVAFVMGSLISIVLLSFIFYCILTPIGLIMRLIGRDALHLKKSSFKKDSYWMEHDRISDKKSYERIF